MQLRTAGPNTSVGAAALTEECDSHLNNNNDDLDTQRGLSDRDCRAGCYLNQLAREPQLPDVVGENLLPGSGQVWVLLAHVLCDGLKGRAISLLHAAGQHRN